MCAVGAAGARADTATFSNPTPIFIPAAGPGAPYPSTIAAAGLPGTLTDVTVTLHGFGHTDGQDVDALVVSPGGQKVLVLSDSCSGAVAAADITFSGAAAAPLPALAPCPTGTYLPMDRVGDVACEADGSDVFPAPAPLGIDSDQLSAFAGGAPNGVWSLYVNDPCALNTGAIGGGWSITLTTPPAQVALPVPVTPPAANPPKKCKKGQKLKKGKCVKKKKKRKK
jgi:hypothetical protein